MIYKISLSILGIFFSIYSIAQDFGVPMTYQKELSTQFKIEELKAINIVPPEKSSMFLEHKENPPEGIGIGDVIFLDIDLKKQAKVFTLANGDKVFLLKLKGDMAYGLKVIFDQFIIPDSAKMYIYNKEKTSFIGPYTKKDTHHEVRLSSHEIPGDEIIIEYTEPKEINFESQLHIFKAVYLYKDIFNVNIEDTTKTGEKSILPCQRNIECYPSQKKMPFR